MSISFHLLPSFLCKLLLWSGLVGYTLLLQGQEVQKTDTLPEVTVKEFFWFSDGLTKVDVDKIEIKKEGQLQNLAQTLAENSTFYIKEYGAGGVGSASYQGHNASQIQVNWNGFSLNSPMHGQSDLSLINLMTTDKILVQNGIESLASGAGGIGGQLSLQQKVWFPAYKFTKVHLSSSISSFQNFHSTAQYSWSHDSIYTQTSISHQQAQNNYPYLWEDQKLRLQNGETSQTYFQQDFAKRYKKYHTFKGHLVAYQSKRNIPSLAGVQDTFNLNNQLDQGIRASVHYDLYKNNGHLSINTAYIDETIRYNEDESRFYSFKNRITFEKEAYKDLNIHFQTFNEYNFAQTSNYIFNPKRTQWAVQGQVNYEYYDFLYVEGILHQEWLSDLKWLPILPKLQVKLGVDYPMNLTYQLGKNYHYPTFNDLYWNEGGNLNLVPEYGWSQELAFSHSFLTKNKRFHINNNVAAYHGKIHNWIQWTPQLTGLWSAQNLKQVNKSGLEWFFSIQGPKYISINGTYAFTKAINKKVIDPLDNSFNKQLIYVPKHTAHLTGKISFQEKYTFILRQHFTSRRYISSDHSHFLKGYALTDLAFTMVVNIKRQRFLLHLEANNIFNQNYETIAQRPMPRMNWAIRLHHTWSKSKR